VTKEVKYYATGRRKTAIARVWVSTGKGEITVNGRKYEEYFTTPALQAMFKSPLTITQNSNKINIYATVSGGGIAGQAGALRHGIARALVKYDENLKTVLKSAEMLTRDPRMKERKKYGQAGARKRFQFSKR